MVDNFPIGLFVPGLLFLAGGFIYFGLAARAREMGNAELPTTRMYLRSGRFTMVCGLILLALAIPLGMVLQSVLK